MYLFFLFCLFMLLCVFPAQHYIFHTPSPVCFESAIKHRPTDQPKGQMPFILTQACSINHWRHACITERKTNKHEKCAKSVSCADWASDSTRVACGLQVYQYQSVMSCDVNVSGGEMLLVDCKSISTSRWWAVMWVCRVERCCLWIVSLSVPVGDELWCECVRWRDVVCGL